MIYINFAPLAQRPARRAVALSSHNIGAAASVAIAQWSADLQGATLPAW
jgi:hypothetical protein